MLEDAGPLTLPEASSLATMRPRTIRFALAALRRAGLVKDLPEFGDLRRKKVAALPPTPRTAEPVPANR